jgi:hypothetical protein
MNWKILENFPASQDKINALRECLKSEPDFGEQANIQKCIKKTEDTLRTLKTCKSLTKLVSLRTETNVDDKFRSTVISDFMTKHVRIDVNGRSIDVDTLIIREIALYLSLVKKKSYYSDQTVGEREDGTTYIIDEPPRFAIRHVEQHNTKDTTNDRVAIYVHGNPNSGKTIEFVVIAWFVFFVYGRFPVVVLQNYDGKTSRNDVEDNIHQLNKIIDDFLLEKADTYEDLHNEDVRKMYQFSTAQTSDSGTLEQWGETKTQLQEARVIITNAEISHIAKATKLVRNLMRRYGDDDLLVNYRPFALIEDESDAIPEQTSELRVPKTQIELQWLVDNAARIWRVSATLSMCVLSHESLKESFMQVIGIDVPSNYYGTCGHGEFKLKTKRLETTFETNPNLTDAICQVLNVDIDALETRVKSNPGEKIPLKYGTAYIRNGKLAIRQPTAKTRTDEEIARAEQVQQKLKEKLPPEEIAWAANHENILEVSNMAIQRAANYGLSVSLLILSNARICIAMDHVLKQIRDHKVIQQQVDRNRIQGVYLAINGGKDTESQTRSHVLYFCPPLTADILNNAELKTLCEKMLCETAKDGRTIRVKSRFNYKNCLSIPFFLHKFAGCRVAVFLCGNSMVKRAANIRNVYPGEEHPLNYELYVTDQLLECQFGANTGSTEATAQKLRLQNILKWLKSLTGTLPYGTPVLYGSPDMLDVVENSERVDRESYHRLKQKPLWKGNDPELRSVFRNIRAQVGNKKSYVVNRRGPSKRRFAEDQEDCPDILNLQGKKRPRVANPGPIELVLATPSARVNNPIHGYKTLRPEMKDLIFGEITVDEGDITKHYNTIFAHLSECGFTTSKKLEITPPMRKILEQIKSVRKGEVISIPSTKPVSVKEGFYTGGIWKQDTVGYYLTRDNLTRDKQLKLHYCFIKKEELFGLELSRNKPRSSTRCWLVVHALRFLHLSMSTFREKTLARTAKLQNNNGNPYITRALTCWCDVLSRDKNGKMYQLKEKYARLVDTKDDMTSQLLSSDPRLHGYVSDNGFVTGTSF